jgi:hypothetical protein
MHPISRLRLETYVAVFRLKAERDSSNNPSLQRKFGKWNAENFSLISSLIQSLMHPISRIRLKNHVVVIKMKELPSGFRVLSADAVSIESLSDAAKSSIREDILFTQAAEPEKVNCLASYEIDAIDDVYNVATLNRYGFGKYSDLAALQDLATAKNGCQAGFIQMLNKEL